MTESTTIATFPTAMLRAAAGATGENRRFPLHAIHVLGAGSVEATDGVMLVRMEDTERGEDAPTLAPFLVSPGSLDAVLRAEKGTKRAPGRVGVDAGPTNANGHVALRGPSSGLSVDVPKVEGTFPSTDAVIPQSRADDAGVCYVGVDYLARMLKCAADAGVQYVRVQLPGLNRDGEPLGAIRFDATVGDTGAIRFLGALMPVTKGPVL